MALAKLKKCGTILRKAIQNLNENSQLDFCKRLDKAELKAAIELRIDVLRSQNIIPVELSPVFPLDFKVSLLGVNIYRWNRLILR